MLFFFFAAHDFPENGFVKLVWLITLQNLSCLVAAVRDIFYFNFTHSLRVPPFFYLLLLSLSFVPLHSQGRGRATDPADDGAEPREAAARHETGVGYAQTGPEHAQGGWVIMKPGLTSPKSWPNARILRSFVLARLVLQYYRIGTSGEFASECVLAELSAWEVGPFCFLRAGSWRFLARRELI